MIGVWIYLKLLLSSQCFVRNTYCLLNSSFTGCLFLKTCFKKVLCNASESTWSWLNCPWPLGVSVLKTLDTAAFIVQAFFLHKETIVLASQL